VLRRPGVTALSVLRRPGVTAPPLYGAFGASCCYPASGCAVERASKIVDR
jgi:hypothetical protein